MDLLKGGVAESVTSFHSTPDIFFSILFFIFFTLIFVSASGLILVNSNGHIQYSIGDKNWVP